MSRWKDQPKAGNWPFPAFVFLSMHSFLSLRRVVCLTNLLALIVICHEVGVLGVRV
jgi:hypothetical protein